MAALSTVVGIAGGAALLGSLIVPGLATARTIEAAGAVTVTNPASLVNPFIGTANDADDFPGPDVPFGMVQWSPDTTSNPDGGAYAYSDSRITGFALTHLGGVGCQAETDVSVLPTVGAVHTNATVGFRHSGESADAGFYRVALGNGVNTQLTATTRTGMGSFGFPTSGKANLIFKLDASQKGDSRTSFKVLSKDEVQGAVSTGDFCFSGNHYTLYFDMRFSQRFHSSGTLRHGVLVRGARQMRVHATGPTVRPVTAANDPSHPAYHGPLPPGRRGGASPALRGPVGAYVTFTTTRGKPLLAKVGISYVSAADARQNLTRENPGWNFSTIQSRATAAWNNQLNKIQITGGTGAQQQIFYTALYHALLYPSVFSDVNRHYMGVDGRVHTVDPRHGAFYTNLSGWDIYRTQAQLEALLDPSVAGDVAQSMVDVYHQSGQLPKWIEDNSEAYIMVGDPADSILADYYAFGVRSFNASAALAAMVHDATRSTKIRPGGHYLNRPGYLPENGSYGCCNFYGPVSSALEYTTADFALSRFAGALGNAADQHEFVDRAQDWWNLLNPNSGFDQPRLASGAFAGRFSAATPPFAVAPGFVEGDSWIYTGNVPFNLAGLAAAKGGDAAYATYLNTVLSSYKNANGYAYVGNEPSIELPWEYDYIGQPWKTQSTVRNVQDQIWADSPGGLADGNDDLGTMSAWYVWSALGMYPTTPGTSTLALGSPLFTKAVITLSHATLTITAPAATTNAPYVQSLTWNGNPWDDAYAPAGITSTGGALNYTLGTTPNTAWASAPSQAPPSYAGNFVAPPQPAVGPVTSGVSATLCLNVRVPTSTRTSTVGTWACNNSAAEQWTRGTDGTVRALGKCLDVQGSGTKNGTPVDLSTCNGSRAQAWAARNGTLYNAEANKCLNIPGGSATPGAQLSLLTCGTQQAQQWTLPVSANPKAGTLVNAEAARLCVDDTGGRPANGTPVQVYTCNGSRSQNWAVEPDGTLRVNGRCMDVHSSGTRSGTAVDLYTCNGTGAQQWHATTGGQLISPYSGLCLAVPGSAAKPGAKLQVLDCKNEAAEHWALPA